ncbi:sodium/hydrogen exchanger family domain-containing protein [Ditylenchus destructor]|nr:sodium/hydrogen exchanger family domain-containing protein [Ditylenchus destructor]
MAIRCWPKIKRFLINALNHKETNFILTALLTFFFVYIILVGVLYRNVLHPFRGNESKPRIFPLSNATSLRDSGNFSYTIVGGVPVEELDTTEVFVCSVLSLFILWSVALILGHLLNYLMLPPLVGMLITGILFANVPYLKGILVIHNDWSKYLRESAFILILMRCGIGLDPDALHKSLFICGSLGFVSTIFEALAIVLASYFIYHIPVALAIVFSFVLAGTSPAVTVPVIIQLHAEGHGVPKGIPKVALASASIDNIYCVTAFSIALSVVLGDLDYIIKKVPIEILMGIILGLLAAVILACVIAKKTWKDDNLNKTRLEELSLKVLWDLFFLPFLFVLIGLVLDFSLLSLDLLGKSIVIMFVGILARILIVLLISFGANINLRELCLLSFCFTPKVTVQAALAPMLAQHTMRHFETSNFSQLMLQTCILSILVTAPIGQLIIRALGRATLEKEIIEELSHVQIPFEIPESISNGLPER